ncbi:HigA family addiction module antitoxin [Lactobacillus sp. PV034]|uniref:HigA family addiction module antitoxin n=1 Tax=Lactobacillus sp. PV034 TaxID=2594495 RepID=UPI00223F5DE2|nr:HigA family addiction module antitoxin [Lactobacillus sp. PV034]QNQ80548.1 HigA family addiction module antidote protein [Lactobacillus sp. PV034]
MLKNNIPTPKLSEILYEEFMVPLNVSIKMIARATNESTSIIQDILNDKKKITVNISTGLGKLFGVSPKYFFNIQNEIELRNTKYMSTTKTSIPKNKGMLVLIN